MTSSTRGTLVRFAGVGLLNTLVDVSAFVLLQAQLGVAAANVVSSSAGMLVSFVLNGLFTFRAARLTLRQAVAFTCTNVLTLWTLQPLLIHALLDAGGAVVVAKVIALGCCVGVNFAAYRWVVWPAVLHTEATPEPVG